MKRLLFLLVSVLLLNIGFAQPDDETGDDVDTDGVLAFIEDSFNTEADEGLYRATPFVEVVHEGLQQDCIDQNFEDCEPFEWSLPFIPEEGATNAEKVIADEWFMLELRTKHRIGLEIGSGLPLIECLIGAIDIFWLVFEGNIFFPSDQFCDGKGVQLLPACFFACDIPLSACPTPNARCPGCIDQGFRRAMEHAMSTYYPQYIANVYAEAVLPIAALGGLTWSSTPLITDGALIAPVASVENVPDLMKDVADMLIADGLEIDPRAAEYYTQTAAMDNYCRAALLVGRFQELYYLPTESFDSTLPGIPALELHKRVLSDRESAGSTWRRTFAMLAQWDDEALHPKYSRGENFVSNIFGGEPSRLGSATPTHHACLGQVPFFEIYQEPVEVVVPAHLPVFRRASCWNGVIPGLTVAPTVPRLMVFTGPRWHTDWVSVPEGYHIPRTKGEPDVSLRIAD